MPGQIITLTTDFGADSPYVAQMKGAILSLHPQAVLVDVTHSIPPQDIRYGALVLDEVCFRFPADTIHVAVVDPGVGTGREIVYAKIGGQQFLAPDNGLLGMVAARYAPERIIAVTNRAFWAAEVSKTFHGRDIFAPVAARISLGLEPSLLGVPREKLVVLDSPQVLIQERFIGGEVVAVDSFGNLITNILGEHLVRAAVPFNEVSVNCDRRKMTGIVLTYGDRSPGELVALVGSSGRLEIAVVNGNARMVLNGKPGAKVSLSW